tara:strand:- start:148 stop:501 length:354 start_codon:yes stop_codon:yes gene_type:complete
MFKKLFVYLVCLSFVASCSNASKDIAAIYVSPQQYSNYDCDQTRAEMQRVAGKVRSLTGQLDKNAGNDNITTGVSLILFWPAVFFLGGTKEEEAEYARLKGEYDALEQASILKKCSM